LQIHRASWGRQIANLYIAARDEERKKEHNALIFVLSLYPEEEGGGRAGNQGQRGKRIRAISRSSERRNDEAEKGEGGDSIERRSWTLKRGDISWYEIFTQRAGDTKSPQ